ncbi:MAG: hypothetical protein KC476_03275 [Cyanobacteria bacterium HKST-UBA06]|nr:hypothetical protein [Cyanobacteria bacterium HKST-UBA06]
MNPMWPNKTSVLITRYRMLFFIGVLLLLGWEALLHQFPMQRAFVHHHQWLLIGAQAIGGLLPLLLTIGLYRSYAGILWRYACFLVSLVASYKALFFLIMVALFVLKGLEWLVPAANVGI